MFKISTKIALAALISISTLSSVDASRKIRGVEYDEVGTAPLRTIKGEERNRTLFQRTARLVVGERDDVAFEDDNNYNSRSFDREPQPYSSSTYRGTHIGYSDDASFWDKNKGKIIAGATVATVVTLGLVYTAMKYMSYTNPEEQDQNNNQTFLHSTTNDQVLSMAGDFVAEQASTLLQHSVDLITPIDIQDAEVTHTITSSIVNVASSFFAPFSNMVFGNNN